MCMTMAWTTTGTNARAMTALSFPIARRLLAAAFVAAVPAMAAAHDDEAEAGRMHAYRAAFAAIEKENWGAARRHAKRGDLPLADKVLLWYELRRSGSDANFADIARFLGENPDWPGQRELRRRAEAALVAEADDAIALAWYGERPPLTVEGRIRYADALLRGGREEDGVRILRQAWVEGNFGSRQEKSFRKRYAQYLRPEDDLARLDRLVWEGRLHPARRIMPHVDRGYRALAHARLTLRAMKPGVDRAIDLVPDALGSDPGLIYERLRWRREKGRPEQARALLWDRPAELTRLHLWWTERATQVRAALAMGHVSDAYRLASGHWQSAGAGYAEAEWLAGWIALRFLDDVEVALGHFGRMYAAVTTPVSRARGAYWTARAAEALDRDEEARAAYQAAAAHVSTYYGQLAAVRLGLGAPDFADAPPPPGADARGAFEAKEMVGIVRLLGSLEAQSLIDPFVLQLDAIAATAGERTLIAVLAAEVGRPDLAVRIARRARRNGVLLAVTGYPIIDVPEDGPEQALALAVIRQESAFDPGAVSPSGARGLMQLMPATARYVAKAMGIRYSARKLLADPGYNLTLGTAYLDRLLGNYDGSYVLALAAYNAGPGRLKGWMGALGDPRDSAVDVIDWVETIPIDETRNYVQRVLEGLQVYRWRLAQADDGLAIGGDLHRGRAGGTNQVADCGQQKSASDAAQDC